MSTQEDMANWPKMIVHISPLDYERVKRANHRLVTDDKIARLEKQVRDLKKAVKELQEK